MVHLPILGLSTHQQRVCSLYKRALRNLQSLHHNRLDFRYQAVLLRARFDENKNMKDLREADRLYKEGENELFKKQHPIPLKFANSPEGTNYEVIVLSPDWILDHWHPLEKAAYPEYFKRREQRKKDYVIWWEQQYGKTSSNPNDGHH